MQLRPPLHYSGRLGLLLFVIVGVATAYAGSATWIVNPQPEDWNRETNWMPNTIPNSPDDTATFAGTNGLNPVIHSDIQLDTLLFTPDAPAPITIMVGGSSGKSVASLTLSGAGVVNNTDYHEFYPQTVQAMPTLLSNGTRSTIYLMNRAALTEGDGLTATILAADGGTSPDFVGGQIQFFNNSSAGPSGIRALGGENGGAGGEVWFFNNSSADNSDISSGPALDESATPGTTYFMGTSTAANAYIGNTPTQAPGAEGGRTFFLEHSTAANCLMYVGGGAYGDRAGGGAVIFSDMASAGNSSLTAYGGLSGGLAGCIHFLSNSTGGTAAVELRRNAKLDVSRHKPPGVAIGSFAGEGTIALGSNDLTVGTNNLTTYFKGTIEGTGSLIKIGTGELTLDGPSTYSGGTTVGAGVLNVTNNKGSGTGEGPVTVLAGTLGGNGTIAGPVSIGTGSGPGAFLSPSLGTSGSQVPRTLEIQGSLTFEADSTYTYNLRTKTRTADEVVASGVTISEGPHFDFMTEDSRPIPVGRIFTPINNTGPEPIIGGFSNLIDGAVVTVGSNRFRANYHGGDGNDLTLTVVP